MNWLDMRCSLVVYPANELLAAGWRLSRSCWIALAVLYCVQLTAVAQPTSHQIRLELVQPTPVPFVHTTGSTGQRYVVEPMTAGLALFDYDGDGLIDVYLLNGVMLPKTPADGPHWFDRLVNNQAATEAAEPLRGNRLYRNLGQWRFEDVTDAAGVGKMGYGLGVVAGDLNNDGYPDLYVSNFGPNDAYLNQGDGTFTEATETLGLLDSGLSGGGRFGAGVCLLDIDNDGNLDLYCANYQEFTFDKHFQKQIGEHFYHPGPQDFPPAPDLLFRNLGDGRFQDISQEAGINSKAAPGMGVIAADFNADGAIDIFVANDSYPNFLFINDGSGHFSEEALISGVAFDRLGRSNGNMGVDCGDFDNDGLLDLFTTTYQDEMPVLYRQLADGIFEDATHRVRIAPALLPHVNWGTGFIDLDHDGHKDLYVACGHFMDNIQYLDDRTAVKVSDFVLQNNGLGGFVDVTQASGVADFPLESSRGAAFDDLDNDGGVDVVVLNSDAPPSFIRNQSTVQNWVVCELIGTASNRSAAGAVLQLTCGGVTQTAAVHVGRGYQSHYGTRVHFGLGNQSTFQFTIRWPCGLVQEFESQEANRLFRVIEGDPRLYP